MSGGAPFGQVTSQTSTRSLSIRLAVPSRGYGGGYDGGPACTRSEKRKTAIQRMGRIIIARGWGSGFGVRGSGFWFWVLRFWFWVLWFWVLRFWVLGSAVRRARTDRTRTGRCTTSISPGRASRR